MQYFFCSVLNLKNDILIKSNFDMLKIYNSFRLFSTWYTDATGQKLIMGRELEYNAKLEICNQYTSVSQAEMNAILQCATYINLRFQRNE